MTKHREFRRLFSPAPWISTTAASTPSIDVPDTRPTTMRLAIMFMNSNERYLKFSDQFWITGSKKKRLAQRRKGREVLRNKGYFLLCALGVLAR
jgi:hypothetical protein